jgi:prepilin-type processing-associated H-X9-DG protein
VGGFNLLMFDGHAEWWSTQQLDALSQTWALVNSPPWYQQP